MNGKLSQPPKPDRKRITQRVTPRIKKSILETYDAQMIKSKRPREEILERLATKYGKSTRQIERYVAHARAATRTRVALFEELISGTYLEGRVRILDNSLPSRKATQGEILEFYNGAPLNWRIIAADADVRRDQEVEILELLRNRGNGFRILCIVGEFGAGKSTAAWRAAYEMHRAGKTVLHVLDNSQPELWYRLPSFVERIGPDLYILIDDVFRYDTFTQAIGNVNPDLPVTVVATSRSNEYQERRGLRERVERVDLKGLSSEEKEDFLVRLGMPFDKLSSVDQDRVDKADSPLILGMELTKGNDFEAIIRNIVDWLRNNDDMVYRAYEYVCFSYQYGVPIPLKLLERLDPIGRFYGLLTRETASGILYEQEQRPSTIRAKHERIAETAFRFYLREPKVLLSELIEAVDEKQREDRSFVVHLFEVAALKKPDFIRVLLANPPLRLSSIISRASLAELQRWASVYLRLGLVGEARKCLDAILSGSPVDDEDCSALIAAYRSIHPQALSPAVKEKAWGELRKWLDAHPDNTSLRTWRLLLFAYWEPPEIVERMLHDAGVWLDDHTEDRIVRGTYLALVAVLGTRKEVEKAIAHTETWLASHIDDATVRGTYLYLIECQAKPKEVGKAIRETEAWLAYHEHDTEVRSKYLSLVTERGTLKQMNETARKTKVWLEQHEDKAIGGWYRSLIAVKEVKEDMKKKRRDTAT